MLRLDRLSFVRSMMPGLIFMTFLSGAPVKRLTLLRRSARNVHEHKEKSICTEERKLNGKKMKETDERWTERKVM